MTDLIKNLLAAVARTEAAIAAIPANQWVIVWHDCVLKTDGAKVAILGQHYYTGSQKFMEAEAARFPTDAEDSPAVAMSAPAALALIEAKNREMLANLPKAAA
jgi:hypothetical protein